VTITDNLAAGTFLYWAYPVMASSFVKWATPDEINSRENKTLPTIRTISIYYLSLND
jgi:hypothetical protein